MDEAVLLASMGQASPRNTYGDIIGRVEMRHWIERISKMDASGGLLPILLPWTAEDERRRRAPQLSLFLQPPSSFATEEGVVFEPPLLKDRRLPYRVLVNDSTRNDAERPIGFARLAQAASHIAQTVPTEFAFGGSFDEFFDPTLTDPRSKAWGMTYYGPEMVSEIGKDLLSSAPVERMESDERGGIWLLATARPFVSSEEKEERCIAVGEHLSLHDRFP